MNESERQAVGQWITSKLESQECIREAYIFGSFLDLTRVPRDVDLLCVLSEYNAKNWSSAIRADFLQVFKLPLHLQRFHQSAQSEIDIFLRTASKWEKVL